MPREDKVLALRDAILSKLTYAVGRTPGNATDRDWFEATALAVRDKVIDLWTDASVSSTGKHVYYLSAEFLIGRLLGDTMGNLLITEDVRDALTGLGVDLDHVRGSEPDAALGNGGLGRLAACFMESMASLGIPAYGYGIRYEHGLFRQAIQDGAQHEMPDDWLIRPNPWEFERPDTFYPVGFGGHVEEVRNVQGDVTSTWRPAETVKAVAYDTPVVGWRGRHIDTLRLWSARAFESLHLHTFNHGDHIGALASRTPVEAISRVLYPGDESEAGRELRLRQQFFFVSASLQDLIARHLRDHGDLYTLPDHAAIQLNDTHPAIAVAELMRLLMDEHCLGWEASWSITTRILNYTNHTLMPEALERWAVGLMDRLLPRHMQIIYRINWLHLEPLIARNEDASVVKRVSIIDEDGGRFVRMGNLAFVGSHKVNGVSALHSELVQDTVFRDMNAIYPNKITNKTNGITFRRWLHQANPALTSLLVRELGPRVLDDFEMLSGLEALADKPAFQAAFMSQRAASKLALAKIVEERTGVIIDPAALFDIQVKRIHEYKRQLLNIFEAVALYHAIKANPNGDWVPRVKILAGKAAPSYHRAKQVIRLANDVMRAINADPVVSQYLKVVFIPNYSVSLAEAIIPAADLSEQISTAGMEASGTGNMKFALNGAITIGTLDGANVEIRENVGDENIVIFGLKSHEVDEMKRAGWRPNRDAWSPRLKDVFETIWSGAFSPDDRHRYDDLLQALVHDDPFMVTADFDSYWFAQRRIDRMWCDQREWWRSSILNTARVAWFSSDRTIREYAEEIWKVPVA
ncbi:MAG: glycogen/starch/alpha-glucan phosphorylase [Microvirga sp.]